MQGEMPNVLDLNQESEVTKKLYGMDRRTTASFGTKMLDCSADDRGRRSLCRITHGNWDHHFNIKTTLPASCDQVDQGVAGLLTDLEQRGLLDETLVVWTGEFVVRRTVKARTVATTTTKPSLCGWPAGA